MKSYNHLSKEEREYIMIALSQGIPKPEIAQKIKRDKSTIYREISRNKDENGYSAFSAQEQYSKRRRASHPSYRLSDPEIHAYVEDKFHNHQWSPEQISARLKYERASIQISTSTIYRGIYSGKLNRLEDKCLCHRKLRHRGKTRNTKNHHETRGQFQISNDISDRPIEAENRVRIGDWEADTVAGVNGKACLVTLVDRLSRFLICCKVDRKNSEYVTAALISLLRGKPLFTITPDRGKEFANYRAVMEALGVEFYFPLPHQPWKRGTNENTNGLLREYFPKSKDISDIPDEYIQAKVDELNHRPRKCLGYKTPFEVYFGIST